MKLIAQFNDFLGDTVNINQDRLNKLDNSADAIETFIRNSQWTPPIIRFVKQGSWAHQTIIKPIDGSEYDADLLALVEPVEGWTARDYINELARILRSSGVYADKVSVFAYCVTLNYAGERKIDIAPCVVGRQFPDTMEVCNRSTDEFVLSTPIEYTNWIKERNAYSGSNSFRKVTRLIKYLRDIKGTFTCPSVLLTTLVGNQIDSLDKDSAAFSDVPTALRTVIGRLDDWLQMYLSRPAVLNPKLLSEDLGKLWTDAQYSNFRVRIHTYREWIDDAYACEDRQESIQKWQRVFGESFGKGANVLAEKADTASDHFAGYLSSVAAHSDRLVDAVRAFGVRLLPDIFNRPPHMRAPTWRRADDFSFDAQVSATWFSSRDAYTGREVVSGEALGRNGGLWFNVTVGGTSIPEGYMVQWRITNTGATALKLHAGRGDFYAPQRQTKRWEELQYRGVHIAEAFVLRMRDDTLVRQSRPFHVVIE